MKQRVKKKRMIKGTRHVPLTSSMTEALNVIVGETGWVRRRRRGMRSTKK